MDSTVRSAGVLELPRPGDVVSGKYRIDSVVGTGGMGVVMGATDTSLGRPVAIKFLAPNKLSRDGAVLRFLREARAAAAIQSEHVVRVYEVGTLPEGAPFIVMERLRGADLAHVLSQRGALPIDEACDFVLQACEALAEAHRRGIVHRDLKPQNLFFTQTLDGSPCVKVLDFGISKAEGDGSAPNLTSTDTVMGTPLYMSPEQVRSLKNVDARSDIWALGVILFELLTRSPVYQAPSASALCAMIAMDPPTPLRHRRPNAPAALEAVILRCLHKDPAGRFQDVAALAGALAPFASERGRLSVTRVTRVAHAGVAGPSLPGSAPTGALVLASSQTGSEVTSTLGTSGSAPTVGAPSFGTPPAPSVGPSRAPAPFALPHTTQNTWHQPQATGGKKPTSGIAIALAFVLTGLAVLAFLGGGGYLYYARHRAAAADTAAPVAATDAGTAGAMTATPSPAVPSVPTQAPLPSKGSAAKPGPVSLKDGGAPSSAKDGGAGPAPAPDKDEQERNLALGRQAEQSCRFHTQQMTTFARDDAGRKRAAEQAKTFTCRGMVSSRCERQVCLNACTILNDQACIRSITYIIEQGPPPKY